MMIKIKNLVIVATLLIPLVGWSNSSDATHTDADLSGSNDVSNQIDDEGSSQQMVIENSPIKVSGAFIDKNIIATDLEHIFAIRGNGKVVATGSNREGELDTSAWENIVSVYADTSTAFGIAKDGTVCSSGMDLGESDLAVIEGATSLDVKGYLIAVKEDGTIALPNYAMDKSLGWIDEALKWDGILKATSYGYEESAHIVGLKNDGTVVAAGNNEYGQCNVSDWENIIAIDVGRDFTVGLRDDGTVAIAGKLTALELEDRHSIETVDAASLGWTDIVAICAGSSDNLIGLKSDGTVVAVGFELSDWKDIVAIDATNYVAVGLKSNGTVIIETDDETMQWWEETEWEYCTDTWNDIRLPE